MTNTTMTNTTLVPTMTTAVKTLCFSQFSLNQLLSEIYATTAEVTFSEDLETEVVRTGEGREFILEDAFADIEDRFNVAVESYDVMDLGELGENFVFFLL